MDDGNPTNGMHGTYDSSLFMCVYYIVIGAIASICNIVCLVLYTSTVDMCKKYIFFVAFEIGELINSISFILSGSGRLQALLSDALNTPTSVHQCFFEHYWVQALILGTQTSTLFLTVIAAERMIAVKYPSTYRVYFSFSHKVVYVAACTIISLILLGIAALSALGNEDFALTAHCPIISSTSVWFSTLHFSFLFLGHLFSLASLLIVWMHMKNHEKEASKHHHDEKIATLIVVTACSTVTIIFPGLIMTGIRLSFWIMDDIPVALTYSLTAMISITTTITYFKLRDEFRTIFWQKIRVLGIVRKTTKIQNEMIAHHANHMIGTFRVLHGSERAYSDNKTDSSPSVHVHGRNLEPLNHIVQNNNNIVRFEKMFLIFSLLISSCLASTDEVVTYGSVIKLQNSQEGARLHSHEVKYGSGSGQQSVTAVKTSDDVNSHWAILQPNEKAIVRGEPVKCGDQIRLQHLTTRCFLHSHHFPAPLSKNNLEVSCFGSDNESDTGDHWEVVCSNDEWYESDSIRLQHVDTGAVLALSGQQFGRPIAGQREVVGSERDTGSVSWRAAEGVYIGRSKPEQD